MAASQGAAGGEVAFRGAMGVGGVAVDLDEVGVAGIAVAPEEGVVDRCGGVVERCAVECKVGDDMAVGDAAIIEVYAALVVGGVVGDKAVADWETRRVWSYQSSLDNFRPARGSSCGSGLHA